MGKVFMTLLERIKQVAQKQGMSLTELNNKAGFGTNVIYSWKSKTPSVDKIEAVANVLNVSTDYLLGRTSEPHDKSTFSEETDAQSFFRIDLSDIPEKDRPKIKKQMEQFKKILLEDM